MDRARVLTELTLTRLDIRLDRGRPLRSPRTRVCFAKVEGSMTIAVWSNQYETGIDRLDSQHKALFGALNSIDDAINAGGAAESLKAGLDFLARYTMEHFQAEETAMRVMGYPKLASHQVEHGKLVSRLQDLQVKQANGSLLTSEVARFISEWMAVHINEVDMEFMRFAKTKAQYRAHHPSH